MRVVADLRDNFILQVEKTPPIGEETDLTGKYIFPIPDGSNVRVNPSSIIEPYADPNSIVTQAFLALLDNFPQYSNILFNPLILDTDIDQIDISGILNVDPNSFVSRLQIGRGSGLGGGNAPNSVALLAQNDGVSPSKPGVLVSNTYDISILTGGLGASDFTIYWKVYQIETDPDIRSFAGLFQGQNTPALRKVIEINQEIPELEVFISSNSGIDFFPVSRLIPISLCSPTKEITLGFKNTGSLGKIYLASYAILF